MVTVPPQVCPAGERAGPAGGGQAGAGEGAAPAAAGRKVQVQEAEHTQRLGRRGGEERWEQ